MSDPTPPSATAVEPEPAPSSRRVAVLDLGSNSFHMTLAEVGPQGIKTYHREKRKVQLAAGLSADGILDQPAIDRALETLGLFGQILQDFQPDIVRAAGTYTFRAARNIEALVKPARKLIPGRIEILEGIEEARLIYQGVSHGEYRSGRSLVVDIGGGSTELIIGEHHQPLHLHSCNMGCVSFSQRFFANGNITRKAFDAAIVQAEQELEAIRAHYQATGWDLAIGSSGTIKALAQCVESAGISSGALTLPALEELKKQLIRCGHIDQIDLEGLPEDRRSVICGGLAVLLAVFDLLDVGSMDYSDSALREGLLLETQERLQLKDNRHHSVQIMARRFACDEEHAGKVQQTALALFDTVAPQWDFDHPDYRNLLQWACQLHEAGRQINHMGCHKHAAYIVSNANLAGFDRERQQILAFLLLCHRKSLKLSQAPELDVFCLQRILKLALLLRLAIRLNQFRQNEVLHSYHASAPGNAALQLEFQPLWQTREMLFHSDLTSEQEQFLPHGIHLSFSFLQEPPAP